MRQRHAEEGVAVEGEAVGGLEHVHAQVVADVYPPGGLLLHFAQGGVADPLAGLQVAGGLVEQRVRAAALLLHHQEGAGALHHAGDGDIGVPAAHGLPPRLRVGPLPGPLLRPRVPWRAGAWRVSRRHSPGARPSSRQGPMATRTRRRVGWPTWAVMRLTWRLRPSPMVSSSQLVTGCRFGSRGGSRSGRPLSARRRTFAGLVMPSPSSTPSRSARRALSSGTPSTWTR